jgi:methionine aminopeptidase
LDDCLSEHAEKYGYGVVERFVGHGVGTVFHSEPLILHNRKYLLTKIFYCSAFFAHFL